MDGSAYFAVCIGDHAPCKMCYFFCSETGFDREQENDSVSVGMPSVGQDPQGSFDLTFAKSLGLLSQ
jgi:hypothetical protein